MFLFYCLITLYCVMESIKTIRAARSETFINLSRGYFGTFKGLYKHFIAYPYIFTLLDIKRQNAPFKCSTEQCKQAKTPQAQQKNPLFFVLAMVSDVLHTTISCGMKFLTPICRFVKKCGVCVNFFKSKIYKFS